jgi:ADP-heptose:LPS heptosyltransferase
MFALISELAAPVLRAYARHKCGSVMLPPHTWRRALIVGDAHIGDILYRTCSLEALKQGLPECDLYYLVTGNTAALLENNPSIKEILPWVRSDSSLGLLSCHEAQLKALRFDVVLCTNPIRYWPDLALAIRMGVPNRVGYIYKGFSGWVTHPMPIRYPQSYPAYFRDYVAALTAQEPVWPLRPRVYLNPADHEEAMGVWNGLNLDPKRPVLACFMTTRQRLGALPLDLIGETLKEIKRLANGHILLMGANVDAAMLDQVNLQYGLEANVLAGALGLRALSAFLGRCDAVLTSDSGPRHLANAAGVPVFFFRNLWSSSVETGCYAAKEIDLCPPDIQRLDEAHQRLVLAQISPTDVAAHLVSGLRNKGKPS